jgi:hypothetical protein
MPSQSTAMIIMPNMTEIRRSAISRGKAAKCRFMEAHNGTYRNLYGARVSTTLIQGMREDSRLTNLLRSALVIQESVARHKFR